MENKPLISIITPVYNAETFIEETIKSVMDQSYDHWEMILIDDCSTDNTRIKLSKYKQIDNRIKIVHLKENKGPAIARNTGLNQAKGRYIAFLDSDDQWLPHKLDKQLNFMQKKAIAFSYTAYNRVQMIGNRKESSKEVMIPDHVTYKDLLKENVIGCLTVMIDTSLTGPIQMVNIRTRQDYALWLELTRRGFIAHGLQDILANYRVRDHSVSSNKVKMVKQNWRVYRDIEKLSLPKSIWYFLHYIFLKMKRYSKY